MHYRNLPNATAVQRMRSHYTKLPCPAAPKAEHLVSYSIPTQDHGSSYCVQLGVLNGNQQTAAEHVANKVHATTPVAAVAGSGRKEGQKSERASWYWQGSGCEDHPRDVAAGINCPRNLPAAGGTGCVAIATLVVEPVETAAVAAGVAAVGNAGSAICGQ